MIKGPTSKMRVRTRIIALFLSLLGFYVFFHLIQLTLIDGDTYQLKALDQQLKDTSISPKRGTIYDANMKVLAKSASVWTVYIIPKQIKDDAQRELLVNGLSELL
ncbi:stage V sporulation protein D, partial [Akkermansia muciniphila]